MPEGPEVRRAADRLHAALAGKPIEAVGARTKAAKAWLKTHEAEIVGRRVERVTAHGKHLLGEIEGGYFFHSHFLMWGRWLVVDPGDEAVATRDRRERARIVVADAAALLYSAPKFDIGPGDPYDALPHLRRLGPDVLDEPFDAADFLLRLDADLERTLGAVLLDQSVAAGIGNYLRAEILWACRIDPWRLVGELDGDERACLAEEVPRVCRLAYEAGGRTVSEAEQAEMQADRDLRYSPFAKDFNTRHAVFRRTNLPCLRCDDYVRQQHQLTREWTDDETGETVEKKRIIYFCPTCQGTSIDLRPPNPHRDRRPPDSEWTEEPEPEDADA
ncbi:MAG: DNA-formamidopyrimidine glycosylase family protein [Rhodothermales bacterium]